MKFLLGTKQAMSQVFDETGRVWPVTVVATGPMSVTQIKTSTKDKYAAIQFGFGARRVKNINKAQRGHQKLAVDAATGWRYLREARVAESDLAAFAVGQQVDADIFTAGDLVAVSAVSKGKGFQGVVKRHGFHGGARSHGQKHSEREPGSIGGGGRAGGRVAKGVRMAGRMGGEQVTVRNLRVIKVDPDKRELLISGAIPGRRGTLVEIRGEG